MKYPLSLLAKIQQLLPDKKLVGYDIGCSFRATAKNGIPELNGEFVIPAMHGYAHNRKCQLTYHPRYKKGAGLEDFETCERFFSLSNNCAGITRYTTAFHRLQLLDNHFSDSDDSRRLSLGKFIFNNYQDALQRIQKIELTFTQLGLREKLLDGTYEQYLQEETLFLSSLSLEPLEDQSRFHYIEALDRWFKARKNWEIEAANAGYSTNIAVSLYSPLPAKLQAALTEYNEANAVAAHFENVLRIPYRWEPDSKEYKDACVWANERSFCLALDRLERLVIQWLFELQKANIVSTGEFFIINIFVI
jgi:hypothetical protein